MSIDKLPNELDEIWPSWTTVPTKIRRRIYDEKNENWHSDIFDFEWSASHKLSLLKKRKSVLLPGHRDENEWGGVYRVFLPDTTIERFCGSDPTGTLYLGMAGTGTKSWSILKTRIGAFATGSHHATAGWQSNASFNAKYSWQTVSVQCAYIPKQLNEKNRNVAPQNAEFWLLRCYWASLGELPPLNQKG